MKAYTKLYFEYFDYGPLDFVPCEICGSKAVDIHHIEARGRGGTKTKDVIENLMAVCRKCHQDYGDIAEYKQMLKDLHAKVMSYKGHQGDGVGL